MKSEILIVGAGPLGMCLALTLKQGGLEPLVVDARAPGAAGGDPRVLALSPGTQQTLKRLGVWEALAPTAIDTIHISQKGGFGRARLKAADYGMPALGYVQEAGALAQVLEAACLARGVAFRHHVKVTDVFPGETDARVILEGPAGEERLDAALVAWAEGRLEDGEGVMVRDYGQHAVITLVHTREARGRVAFERFTKDGPLALLPCGTGYAVVFTAAPETARELLALDDGAFLARLQAQFGDRLHFTAAEPRHAYPLLLKVRDAPVGPRQVWLGNSAQTVHPVAGQGFNLALRDAWHLADLLLKTGGDAGAAALLQRYHDRRRLDRRGTIGFTDLLVRLFSNDHPLLSATRGTGLFLLDVLPPARDFVARRMMFGARAW